MLYAAIDIHKRSFQAVVLDPDAGTLVEKRFSADRDSLAEWAREWQGRLVAVAIEATTGWRWVARELQALGFDVRLADPAQARARAGRRRQAKTDRLDARWLCVLLARSLLPEAWLAPAEIQLLRQRTRLRLALAQQLTSWAQRLHAILQQEGWPCARARLLTVQGRRWARALELSPETSVDVETCLGVIEALEAQLEPVERELRRFARCDRRCQALQRLYGVGPIIACHLLAELGEPLRFRRSRQAVRHSGLDPSVSESGETRRRGKLSKQGSPQLRWALVQAAQHARRPSSPEHGLYLTVSRRVGAQRATLTVARKLCRQAHHLLRELDAQAA